jgi:hypothetical protein
VKLHYFVHHYHDFGRAFFQIVFDFQRNGFGELIQDRQQHRLTTAKLQYTFTYDAVLEKRTITGKKILNDETNNERDLTLTD